MKGMDEEVMKIEEAQVEMNVAAKKRIQKMGETIRIVEMGETIKSRATTPPRG